MRSPNDDKLRDSFASGIESEKTIVTSKKEAKIIDFILFYIFMTLSQINIYIIILCNFYTKYLPNIENVGIIKEF